MKTQKGDTNMRIKVRLGSTVCEIDESRHSQLTARGFRAVSGKLESAVFTKIAFSSKDSQKAVRDVKLNDVEIEVEIDGQKGTVAGNEEVFYILWSQEARDLQAEIVRENRRRQLEARRQLDARLRPAQKLARSLTAPVESGSMDLIAAIRQIEEQERKDAAASK